MNSSEIFTLALGLSSPWYVENSVIETNLKGRKELHIYIGFKKGHKFIDDAGVACDVHDTRKRDWQHLHFFEHECYLHCNIPRIKNSAGKVVQISVPWAREGSGFSLLFEAFSMQLIEYEMPVSKVACMMGVYDGRIWRVFDYWVNKAYSNADHSTITQLGIDETSTKKGHNYITLAVDLEHHNVVHAVPGKDAETITKIRNYLDSKGTGAECITDVSIDLSPAFIGGAMSNFANAKITFDRFHVKKLLNKAMDEVRKTERKEHDMLKGHRYLFLKSNAKMSKRQRENREKYLTLLPVLGEAYRLKELFDDFWDMKEIEDASGFLLYWTDLAMESGIQPFIKFSATIKAHWYGIINYINTRITNGILEGINSKIQLAKKRARGYRNIGNFINMIYFLTGKLKYDYPH